MPRTKTAHEPMIFRGPPRRLRLHSELPDLAHPIFEPDEALTAMLTRRRPFRSRTNRDGKLRKLSVKLDYCTPPGDYHATLKSDNVKLPIVIHVEAHPRLAISPSRLEFVGKAGSKPRAHLLFINKGNVPLEIPKAVTVSMCDDKGLDKAYTSTLLMESSEIGTMFTHFVNNLRASHGGLLPAKIIQGSGLLGLRQQISAIVEAEFSARFLAGHSYHGILTINSTSQLIGATVTT